jgi:hypothetical protein
LKIDGPKPNFKRSLVPNVWREILHALLHVFEVNSGLMLWIPEEALACIAPNAVEAATKSEAVSGYRRDLIANAFY